MESGFLSAAMADLLILGLVLSFLNYFWRLIPGFLFSSICGVHALNTALLSNLSTGLFYSEAKRNLLSYMRYKTSAVKNRNVVHERIGPSVHP